MTAPKVQTPETPATEPGTENILSFEEFEAAMNGGQEVEAEAEESESAEDAEAAEDSASDEEGEAQDQEQAEDDTEPEGDEPEQPAWLTEFEKTGDSSVLPAPIRSKISRLMVRLGMARADYERKSAQIEQTKAPAPKPAEADDDGPQLDYTDQDALKRSFDARARWIARKEAEARESGSNKKVEEAVAQLNDLRVKAMSQERYDWLRGQDGWTADVEEEMKQMATESEFWQKAYWDDDGLREFYATARNRVNKRGTTVEKAKHNAAIPKKVMPRPSGGGVATKAEATTTNPYHGLTPEQQFERIARDELRKMQEQGLL